MHVEVVRGLLRGLLEKDAGLTPMTGPLLGQAGHEQRVHVGRHVLQHGHGTLQRVGQLIAMQLQAREAHFAVVVGGGNRDGAFVVLLRWHELREPLVAEAHEEGELGVLHVGGETPLERVQRLVVLADAPIGVAHIGTRLGGQRGPVHEEFPGGGFVLGAFQLVVDLGQARQIDVLPREAIDHGLGGLERILPAFTHERLAAGHEQAVEGGGVGLGGGRGGGRQYGSRAGGNIEGGGRVAGDGRSRRARVDRGRHEQAEPERGQGGHRQREAERGRHGHLGPTVRSSQGCTSVRRDGSARNAASKWPRACGTRDSV